MHLCTVKNDKHIWSIHLRARIPASHAGHRGSNPLSTTKEIGVRCTPIFLSSKLPNYLDAALTKNLLKERADTAT